MKKLLIAAIAFTMAFGFAGCGSKNDDKNVQNGNNAVTANEGNEDNVKNENTVIGIWHNVSSIKIGDETYRGSDDPNMITCEFSENQTLVFKSAYDTRTFLFTSNEFSNWVSGSWVLTSTDDSGISEYTLYCDGKQFGTATFDSSDEGGLTIMLDYKNSELHFDSQSCKYVEN